LEFEYFVGEVESDLVDLFGWAAGASAVTVEDAD
jgi:hypothetical protein